MLPRSSVKGIFKKSAIMVFVSHFETMTEHVFFNILLLLFQAETMCKTFLIN